MPPNSTLRQISLLAITLLLGGNLYVGARIFNDTGTPPDTAAALRSMERFSTTLEQVRAYYVDPNRVDYDSLLDGALEGMLHSLDPHSQFLTPEEYKELQDDTAGRFGGVGVVVSHRDGVLVVISPMEDTPAWRAGMMPGDTITSIDGQSALDMPISHAVKTLRGKPGTPVDLGFLRAGEKTERTVHLVREIIDSPSVKDTRLLRDHIGYLRITQFADPTASEVRNALDSLVRQGMNALVVDLRNNPGGLFHSAIDIAGMFLERRQLVVFTQGRTHASRKDYLARGARLLPNIPIAILVNGGSASASEILAGALKDNHRAVLIGERTFGKGSVQSILPLGDGSAIRLTTAKYYTPSGQSIHNLGIDPDIPAPMSDEDWQLLQMNRARQQGNIPPPSTDLRNDVVDTQLERAIGTLRGIMAFQKKTPPSSR